MSDSPQTPFSRRLDRLRAMCAEAGVDAVVITNLQNIRYLTGFAGSAGVLVVAGPRPMLLADGRYVDVIRAGQSTGAITPLEVVRVRRYDDALIETLRQGGWPRVAYEADAVTVAQFDRWRAGRPGGQWHPAIGWVETGRLTKDDGEIACLRRAAKLLSDVARAAPSWVRPGRAERDIAGDIDLAMRRAGFEKPAFDTIVASGPNTAFPHARPTERLVGQGDLVLLDFGGVLEGYCVDLTRMVSAGRAGADALALYRAVRAAHAAAVAEVAPGRLTTDVDGAARQVLEDAQLGNAFVHGTGHGLGLDVHEAPRVGPGDPREATRLEAGMVLTIEPGAYVVGLGGVRIEDDVLVTEAGREVLTDAPLDLVTV